MSEFDITLLIYGLLLGLGAGMLGGVLAGLAGVGGGLIYAPLFYAFMPTQNSGMALAIFASLLAIVITGFFSARAHWRLQHVDRSRLVKLLPGLIIGAALGLWSTLQIAEFWILLSLALLNAWVAYDYGKAVQAMQKETPSLPAFSGPIGYISGFLGIGGGTMLVPLLRRHIDLRHAVGTSAICGAVMAISAISLNLAMEENWHDLIAAHRDFLLAAWLGILLVIPLSSAWAAGLHARIAEHSLRLILKSIFILLSTGLFIAAFLAS